mgnify:CR=1 FL=1
MAELGSAEYPKNVNIRGYKPNTDVHIGQLKRAIKLLNKAKRPLFLAGGGVVISRAHEIFREVVEKTKVPVVTTVMGKGSIPTDHPLYNRKPWHAWCLCSKYGSQQLRCAVLHRNQIQ